MCGYSWTKVGKMVVMVFQLNKATNLEVHLF
jgi:hypothetical protein